MDVTLFPSFFKLIVTWGRPTIPNGIITGYEVIYWPVASPETATTVNTGLETTYILSGLDVGMEFSFTVRAFTQLGPGQPVTVTVSTLSIPCKDNKLYIIYIIIMLSVNIPNSFILTMIRHYILPTAVVEDVVATEVNATAVMIVWQALELEQLIHYTVLYSAVVSGRAEEKSVTFPISHHSGVVGGLEPGQQYMFQVMAVAVINGSDVDGERSAVSITTTFGGRYYYYNMVR